MTFVFRRHLLEKYKYKRIAIIDFDVHHGNGTQNIFYSNEKVLYISTHQYPHFPGTGANNEKGKYNNILNIPLPAGTNAPEFFNSYEHVLKKLKEFKPEFLLISAGFAAWSVVWAEPMNEHDLIIFILTLSFRMSSVDK